MAATVGVGLLTMGVLVTAVFSGCAPEPAPPPTATPTVTAPTSEEEAFRAAEATYRAYVDALNRADTAVSPAVDPREHLIGRALKAESETAEQFESLGISLVGELVVDSVDGVSFIHRKTLLAICLDVSATTIRDEHGNDVTPIDRPDLMGLKVTFETVNGRTLISDSTASEQPC